MYVMTDFTESNFKFWAEHPVSECTVLEAYGPVGGISNWYCCQMPS